MPYPMLADPLDGVRNHPPEHAQEIFRAAFNNAWRAHAADPAHRRAEAAHASPGLW